MTASAWLGSLLGVRKIETEVEARRCLVSAEMSGLSLAVWARGQGIEALALHRWNATIKRRQAAMERAGPRMSSGLRLFKSHDAPRMTTMSATTKNTQATKTVSQGESRYGTPAPQIALRFPTSTSYRVV